jgi:hypothetical protein
MTFTKREFEAVTARAEQADSLDAAMQITQSKVLDLDAGLVTGKYVEKLRQIANRYERMYWRERNGEPRRELPYAG